MSTRYVWNRYNIITELVGSERTAYAVSFYSGKYIYSIQGSSISSVVRPIYYHVTNNVQEFFNSEAAITFEGSISNTGTINIPAGNYIAFSTTPTSTPGEGSFYYRAPDTGGQQLKSIGILQIGLLLSTLVLLLYLATRWLSSKTKARGH